MPKNLVIVESPAKAKTIEKFLGKDFTVKSSNGHIRDLVKKDLGIDIENNFEPKYSISVEKRNIVSELKKEAAKSDCVWLASDEDREGEAIAWHLAEALKLNKTKTKRIVFHEITKDAIVNAIKKPRVIDQNLVDAQQARRILDRIVGFELSPILWRKIKPGLSAGRVQSVAVRLIVEREKEISSFKPETYYRVVAHFISENNQIFKAELSKKLTSKNEALELLESCKNATYNIDKLDVKPLKKTPAAPFTTSTLQQEASRKLGFSVARTMRLAQELYEAGFITYMRTDSVNLSDLAINTAKSAITEQFGKQYSKTRKYATKSKGAQEAHEAIRPTYIQNSTVKTDATHQKLYQLIWKRTIASQMSDAQLEKTSVKISISNNNKYHFVATGQVIKFDGFLKVYIDSDDENALTKENLPQLKVNETVTRQQITAQQRFSNHPPRYSEASLVRKLEELGIGRPSTYAPTISTIQKREYIVKEDREGYKREYNLLTLENDQISDANNTENTGVEKGKLFPTDIGKVVNDFLVLHFKKVMDYNFTASVEQEFDDIASGNIVWHNMLTEFYHHFHERVEETIENAEKAKGERLLGKDPKSGKNIYAKIGRYGPVIQIGETDDEEKPLFARITKEFTIDAITLNQALGLIQFPRNLGQYQELDITVAIGRFGPYVRHNNKFYSIPKTIDPKLIDTNQAIELIIEGIEKEKKKHIKSFENETIKVLNGRWGPYISYNKKNFKIPKSINAQDITLEQCKDIIAKTSKTNKGTKTTKATKTKKSTNKKTKA